MEICKLMRETLNRVARLTKKMLHFSNTDHSDDEIQDEDELKVILGFKLVPDLLLLFFLNSKRFLTTWQGSNLTLFLS